MDPSLRVVVGPFDELFDSHGTVPSQLIADIGVRDVKRLLREGAVGVIVEGGRPMQWLAGRAVFEWWKREAAPRMCEPGEAIYLEQCPGDRCWTAQEWQLDAGGSAIAFYAHH